MADGQPAFLGTGWHFPPTFSQSGAEVQTVSAEDDIRESLEILLATAQGERIMQEDFGCDLNSVLFEEIDQSLLNRLTQLISDAILYYEPRITLDDLNVSESPETQGLLLISIEYTVASTNSRYNLVYPFYVNEAVA